MKFKLLMPFAVLLSCKSVLTSSEPTQLSATDAADAVSPETKAFETFCKTAQTYMGPGFEKEIGFLCAPTKTKSGKDLSWSELGRKAYTTGGSTDEAIQMLSLSHSGYDTRFAYAGALKVNKSIRSIELVRKKSLEMSSVDPEYGIEIAHSVVKENPPSKKGQMQCYDINETVKDMFGSDTIVLEECFYSLSDQILVSYAGPKNGGDSGRSVFLRIETAPSQTTFFVATSKTVKNRGFPQIAQDVVSEQGPEIIKGFHKLLSQAPDAETIPKKVSFGAAKDDNNINPDDDWSWGRTKLSCKSNQAIYGVIQNQYSGAKTKSVLQIECGLNMQNESLNATVYREAKSKLSITDRISCEDDEYAVGISYFRHRIAQTVIDGVKSMLCMKKKSPAKSCTKHTNSCQEGEYLKAIELKRIGGFICDSARVDDAGNGCYRIEKVECCK